MSTSDETAFLASYNIHDYDVPLTTVDVVVFALVDDQLCVHKRERIEATETLLWRG